MAVNLKSQLNGLRKTNWSNKSESKILKILGEKYEHIGRPLPKYLTNGKLTPKKVNRAVQSLTNMYQRKIEQQTPLTNRLYNKYKQNIKQAKNQLERELQSYPKEVQKAYFKDNKSLIVGREIINKQDLKINSLEYFKKLAKMQGRSLNSVLRDYSNNDGIMTRGDYIKRATELLDDILSSSGLALHSRDKKELIEKLNHVGYLEFDLLIQRWEIKKERGTFITYKESHNLTDKDELYATFLSDIMSYLPNRRNIVIK